MLVMIYASDIVYCRKHKMTGVTYEYVNVPVTPVGIATGAAVA